MPDPTEGASKLIKTRDGSHTVYSSQFDQHYHNPNGAVAESRYVFFRQSGLLKLLQESPEESISHGALTILEVGFGTGLNLMLLLDYCKACDFDASITYYSIEGYPLDPKTAADFNYSDHLIHPEVADGVTGVFGKLEPGLNLFRLTDRVTLKLFRGLFSDFDLGAVGANFIFHDAFSPGANPDLWTGEVFKKLRQLSADDVVLSTYCAASKARGAMAWAGWNVARAKGALGKREMTVAALDKAQLGGRKRVNEELLAQRYKEGDF